MPGSSLPVHSERPTHGQLLRVVHRWCCQHGAEMLGLGLEHAGTTVYWRAEVRLSSGQRVTALGVDAEAITRGLDLVATGPVLN